jgi:predicted flap endonuclease-1-like 5' DNA nuclease
MRLDYVLYAIAVIFFVITVSAVAFSVEQQQVWIVSTVVIGLAFIGAGYTQRRKPAAAPMTTIAPDQPPSPPQQQEQPLVVTTVPSEPEVIQPIKIEEAKPIVEQPQLLTSELTKVKGIGEKRAAQLKALGINTIEDLGKASPNDLATKLNISKKITNKWIENAKEIKQTS